MSSNSAKIAVGAVAAALATFVAGYFLYPLVGGSKSDEAEIHRVVEISGFLESLTPYLESGTSRSHRARFKRTVSKAIFNAMQYHVDEPHEQTLFDGAMSRVEAQGLVPGREAPDRLIEVVIDGMLGAIDPHSGFLPKEAYAAMKARDPDVSVGIGIELTMRGGRVQVVSPIDQTPAARAGLKPGDIITRVDGRPLGGLTLWQAVERMRGEAGASVLLAIQRGGAEPFDVTLTRTRIRLESVRASAEGSTGYIRISTFDQQVHDRLGPTVELLRDRLGGSLNGFVLDLRNNPGGWRDQAVAVADDFLRQGVILTVRPRWRDGVERFEAESGEITGNAPLVVLINEGTASAAEVVAAALQDHGRAVVMGRRSYGKGTQHSIFEMPYNSAMRLATRRLYAPSGRSWDGEGIVPDVAIIGEGSDRAASPSPGASPAAVREDRCPPAGAQGDRVLGCAIALLDAGSLEAFLARVRF